MSNNISISKLSDYFSNWRELCNDKGISPVVDVAHTNKFTIGEHFHQKVYDFYREYKYYAKMGKRSLTIRNIDIIYNYLKYESNIETVISNIVGIDFVLHPMRSEAYLYNLTPDKAVQDNIDNWHYDYMPFVFVYMVEKDDPESGKLVLNLDGKIAEINLGVGEGIFMQGSQIKHLAKRCSQGNRTTLVLSFIPRDVTVRDNTYIKEGMCPYHKGENLHKQFVDFKNERISKLIQMKRDIDRLINREINDVSRSRL